MTLKEIEVLEDELEGMEEDASENMPGFSPDTWPWYPDAMLRDPYPGSDLPCVGEDFEILEDR